MSHPLRMRGLKQMQKQKTKKPKRVASFTDAWVETLTASLSLLIHFLSHPLRMRGLKRTAIKLLEEEKVASFTDAWVETEYPTIKPVRSCVASFTDAWVETTMLGTAFDSSFGRILYGCVG